MSDDLKIEHGVPIPKARRGQGPTAIWNQMQHGDSVLIPFGGTDPQTKCKNAYAAASNWVKKHRPGWHAVSRRESDGVRIWLVDSLRENGAAMPAPKRGKGRKP